MSEFCQVALIDVATHIKDGTHGTHHRMESGIPFLSAKNIGTNGRLNWDKTDDLISESDYLTITSTFTPKPGDLLLTVVGSIGRSALFDGSKVAFQRSVAFVRSGDRVLPEYLLQASCFGAFKRQLEQRCNVTAQAGLYLGELAKIKIPLPTKNQQQKIAAILTSIDTAIEKTEALIEKYQQIKAGLMHDLFTRGVLPNGQLRPTRDQAPELYQETAIGWIPKDWELRNLSTLADVLDPQPDHRTPPESLEGIPYVGIGDFDLYQQLSLSSCRKIIVEAYEKQRQRFLVEKGDVIYGKIGTIGQPKRLPFGGYAVSANVVLLKPKIDSLYFYHAVNSHTFEKQVSNITNTTSQPALGIEKVRNLIIPFPGEVEASKIGTSLHGVVIQIANERRHLDKLKKQKLGLMQDLLTGKVPVKVENETSPETESTT